MSRTKIADKSVVTSSTDGLGGVGAKGDTHPNDPAEWDGHRSTPNKEVYSMAAGQRIIRGDPVRIATPTHVKCPVEELK